MNQNVIDIHRSKYTYREKQGTHKCLEKSGCFGEAKTYLIELELSKWVAKEVKHLAHSKGT